MAFYSATATPSLMLSCWISVSFMQLNIQILNEGKRQHWYGTLTQQIPWVEVLELRANSGQTCYWFENMVLDVSLFLKGANLTKFFCVICKRSCVSVAHPSGPSNLHLTPHPILYTLQLCSSYFRVRPAQPFNPSLNPLFHQFSPKPHDAICQPDSTFWLLFLHTGLTLGSQQIRTKWSSVQTAVWTTGHVQLLLHVFLIAEASWLTGCPSC